MRNADFVPIIKSHSLCHIIKDKVLKMLIISDKTCVIMLKYSNSGNNGEYLNYCGLSYLV